jgi:hypothetical protein
MEDLLISIITDAFGFPMMLQGSLSPNEDYPPHFFTYWNDSSDGESFHDNKEGAIIWAYSLNFYSTDPEKVYSVLMEAKAKLKAAGFIVTGGGHSVPSDEPTHTGRGIAVLYRENT